MTLNLDSLNPQQKLAVTSTEGQVLVLAGAGTGKTKVLTTRIAHIINSNLASVHEILAVTFTNKAAKEMSERISILLKECNHDGDNFLPWVGTFHSIALKILRRHYEFVGLRQNFTILDSDDSLKIIKEILKENSHLDGASSDKFIANAISRLKDKALLPGEVSANINEPWYDETVLPVYRIYQARLCDLNCVDFGDIIMLCIKALEASEDALEYWRNKFKYVMVDEYQDTNIAQYIFARVLSSKYKNICCVGDDDQSIYSWRGAEVGNILQFNKEYNDALIVKLEQNYRSTNNILNAASSVIKQNSSFRFGKKLWSDKGDGNKVAVNILNKSSKEAESIANKAKELNTKGRNYSNMAVLVRASFQTRELEHALNNKHIPYKMIGGTKFYSRAEIKDAIAYLRVIVQQEDDIAFFRIINTPKRGVGGGSIDKINEFARENGLRAFTAVSKMLEEGMFKGKAKENLASLIEFFNKWIKDKEDLNKEDLLERVLVESGYLAMYESEGTEEAKGRIENLNELLASLQQSEKDLVSYLEDASLATDEGDDDNSQDKLSLMTMHSAKGLEYDVVFLPGWEEGIFPSPRSLDDTGNKALEEERRLAYVAITRAKEELFIYRCKERALFGRTSFAEPSRFLEELDKDYIEICKEEVATSPFLKNSEIFTLDDFNNDFDSHENLFFDENDKSFKKDDRVYHNKFGQGKVLSLGGQTVKVKFASGNVKELHVDFLVKLTS